MDRLNKEEISDLESRAARFIGELYPVSAFVKDAHGKRQIGEVLSEFIDFSRPIFATSEKDGNKEAKPVTFPMPIAVFKGPIKPVKKVPLITVVEYFEGRANQV